MASRVDPCVSFDGDARQAMRFYKDFSGGRGMVDAFGEYGAGRCPRAVRLMHAHLETDSGFGVN